MQSSQKMTEHKKSSSSNALLHHAINGNVDSVRDELKRGANVNQTSPQSKYTALHYAAEQDHVLVIRVLHQYQVDVDAVTADGSTALLLAIKHKKWDTVKLLRKYGAKPEIMNQANEHALQQIRLCSPDVSELETKFSNRFFSALLASDVKEFNTLLACLEKNDKIIKRNQSSLLDSALRNSDVSFFNALVEYHIDLASEISGKGSYSRLNKEPDGKKVVPYSGLLFASCYNPSAKALLHILLQYLKVMPGRKQDMLNHTLLLVLGNQFIDNRNEFVTSLLRQGAEINYLYQPEKITPLVNAIQHNRSVTTLKKLIDLGAGVNRTDTSSAPPLHRAVKYGKKEVVKLLTDEKADVTANYNGRLAIHEIFSIKKEKDKNAILKILLAKDSTGTIVNAQNASQSTPLHLAFDEEAIQTLLKNGAKLTIQDKRHRTALMISPQSDALLAASIQYLRQQIEDNANFPSMSRSLKENFLVEQVRTLVPDEELIDLCETLAKPILKDFSPEEKEVKKKSRTSATTSGLFKLPAKQKNLRSPERSSSSFFMAKRKTDEEEEIPDKKQRLDEKDQLELHWDFSMTK